MAAQLDQETQISQNHGQREQESNQIKPEGFRGYFNDDNDD